MNNLNPQVYSKTAEGREKVSSPIHQEKLMALSIYPEEVANKPSDQFSSHKSSKEIETLATRNMSYYQTEYYQMNMARNERRAPLLLFVVCPPTFPTTKTSLVSFPSSINFQLGVAAESKTLMERANNITRAVSVFYER